MKTCENVYLFPYNPADRAEALSLYRDVFAREPWCDKEPREQTKIYFKRLEAMNGFLGYFLRAESGELLALSIGFKKPWIGGEEYYIDQFCVAYAVQGRGVGSRFLSLLKEDLRQKGIGAVMLQTETDAPAFRFYRSNGFIPDEEARSLYLDVPEA